MCGVHSGVVRMQVLSDMTPYRWVSAFRRFERTSSLRHEGSSTLINSIYPLDCSKKEGNPIVRNV